MLKKTETLNTTYITNVEDIRIRYSIQQKDGEPIRLVNANITRNDEYRGTANLDMDGSVGITIAKGFTFEEKKLVLLRLIEDSEEIFSSSKSQTEQ